MAPARLKFQNVTIQVENAVFRANGRIVEFPGFFRAYVRGTDITDKTPPNQSPPLPPLSIDEEVDCRELQCREHETKPPARYTEAALVKVLKDEGIGRPSTYASIINTIIKRGYVFMQRKELVPTFTAFAVTRLMEQYFTDLVDIHFTADMEKQLDNIARGEKGWLDYLSHFYLGEEGLQKRVEKNETEISPSDLCSMKLEDPPGEVRIGRYGPFLSWDVNGERLRTGIRPDIPPADLSPEMIKQLMKQKSEGPQKLGVDPETGLTVYIKLGPFGPYVQKGENDNDGKKPKRIKLMEDMSMEKVTLEKALDLLQLPRELGNHPETGKVVKAGLGRFGPYIVHDGKFASLKDPHNVLDVTLEIAIEILAASPDRKGGASQKSLRDLGEHPEDGNPVRIMTGRYGPYIKHNKLNASIPNRFDPQAITLEEALELLEKKKAKKKSKQTTKAKKGKKKAGTTRKKKSTKTGKKRNLPINPAAPIS
jgi:DNA topoisomerase-1